MPLCYTVAAPKNINQKFIFIKVIIWPQYSPTETVNKPVEHTLQTITFQKRRVTVVSTVGKKSQET